MFERLIKETARIKPAWAGFSSSKRSGALALVCSTKKLFRKKFYLAFIFTPCTAAYSLLEAMSQAAKIVASGDVVLFSPACSCFGQFRVCQMTGERFYQPAKSISRGAFAVHPNISGRFEQRKLKRSQSSNLFARRFLRRTIGSSLIQQPHAHQTQH